MEQVKGNVTVFIADATPMGCHLLAHALVPDFNVVGCESTSEAALQALLSNPADIALISGALQDGTAKGFDLAFAIHSRLPEIRIVLLLDRSEEQAVMNAFRAGARGVFSRADNDIVSLRKCITCVHEGQVWASSAELCHVLDNVSGAMSQVSLSNTCSKLLTVRERSVVVLVAEGLGNRDIAEQLSISEHTVKNYLFRIFDKLGVSSRVELVLCALSNRTAAPGSNGDSRKPAMLAVPHNGRGASRA